MRVIVTGGSGLIGRALVPRLTAEDHEVIVLSRNPQRVKGLPEGARAEGWDGRSTQGWGPLVDGDTAVINLAGENIASGRWTESRKKRILESRVDAGRAVTEALTRSKKTPKVLLQASAVGYYGPTGDREVTESSPAGEDFLALVCLAWEGATRAVEDAGIRRIVLRTGVVLSSEGGALPKMSLPFRFFAGGPAGGGDQYVPWIHIQDEVEAILILLQQEELSGPFNLTAPDPVTNAQLGKQLGAVLHRPSLLPAPAFALRAVLGEMADVLLTGQRALPRRLQEAGFTFRFPRLAAALEDLLG
jgi:uncharacterized protein (TIGR01777 family)